ncbi:elongation factor 1 beta subunit [Ceraceosorus guamensis]|uniref:Elongation factor 1 beta subunit n=1 Tax=Ceraceosorus guamensis TaxID=1522189 RepID=A0A316VXE3_9BASI|nr:elongation factor 1 beta subunit [Ceraceosorus guamensis]PWN42317.1 elongation factor 1 beta subunit [Ceraceosorus guamensis]
MSLPAFNTDAGLALLDTHVGTRSYINGFTASQADVAVYEQVGSRPSEDKYPHAARWWDHIESYKAEHSTLSGDKTAAAAAFAHLAASGSTPAAKPAAKEDDDDDDVDLFGSDDEVDEEAERIKAERVKAYEAKKANKGPGPAAKSVVTLEVKPWDDETDMAELEKNLRSIEQDGLVWGASKLVPVGYGVSKLQITLVVEDAKVSLDALQDLIAEDEDHVQSSDVAAMQKL